MEVTAKNFDEVQEKFADLLKKAQFVAIDTEFTGLRVDGGSTYNYFDTLKEFYEVNRQTACTFLALQYGICLFEYHPENNSYTSHAYNFYVYPASSKRNFTCQVSCLRFLSEHGLDFNKLFRDGISYLRDDETEAKLENLKARREKEVAESPSIKIPKDQKSVIEGVMMKISSFVSSEEEESSLPRYNSFLRRLIYQTAKEKFAGRVVLECDRDGTMRMMKGLSEEEKQKRLEEKWEIEKEDILREVGFSKIIKLLVDSRKPLVGHNLFIDLLFTIQQFLQPLPEDFEEFRELIHCIFPRLIDTKHVATAGHFRNFAESTLADVLDSFQHDDIPVVEPASPEVGYKEGEKRPHEAAFDAYITGLAFLAMAGRLGKESDADIYENLAESPLLQPFVNKLSTPPLHEIPCLNLEGSYAPPNRQNVFHIAFPEQWKREDIFAHFKEFGFIHIRWLDNASAFISVGVDYVKKLKQTLVKSQQSECKVKTYCDFRRETTGAKQEVTNTGKNRKRMSSEDLGDVVSQKRNCNFSVPAFD